MSKIIIFLNKKSMINFQEENQIPNGFSLDYLLDDLPSRIQEYLKEWPDFIFHTPITKCMKKLFFKMPVEWRRDYAWDSENGNYIAFDRMFLNKWNEFDYFPKVWQPPKMMATNNVVIANNKIKKTEPIIAGLLGKGESLLISGTGGIGKSLLVNYMAYVLANQKDLWEKFKIPKPITSLILQSEIDSFAQQERINKLLLAHPEWNHDGVYSVGLTTGSNCQIIGKNLSNSEFQNNLNNIIEEIGADVLFIDPLISFNPVNENDNTKMRKVLDLFMDAIKETGISVIFTHHMNKSGKTRGASAIRDWAANALELRLDGLEDGQARIEVVHDKSRNFEQVNPFYLKRTKSLSFEPMCGDLEEGDIKKMQCVIDTLAEVGGEIEGQLALAKLISKHGIGNRTALKRIKDAVYFGLVFEDKIGHGLPSIYTLATSNSL